MISLVAAMDRNRNIGLNGDMPWGKEMKSDLRRFKNLTDGKILVMGRKTFESLPGILPNRDHIVLSKTGFQYKGTFLTDGSSVSYEGEPLVTCYSSVESVLDEVGGEDIFVIGGASIYEQFMPHADKIYLTKIFAYLEGDTKFPSIIGNWDITQGMLHYLHEDKYGSQHVLYTRRSK